jgi:chromosome segregation ATPase
MEVLFKGFEYAIWEPNGKQYIIERSESTAFLTKHLLMYGGTGSYNDYKVGRLMRDMVFSGKGLVRTPANPGSIVLSEAAPFNSAVSYNNFVNKKEELVSMASSNDDKVISNLEDQNAALQKRISELTDRLNEAGEAQVRKEIDGFKSIIEEKETALAKMTKDLDEKTASYNEAVQKQEETEASRAQLETELEKANKDLSEANDKIVASEAEAKKSGRIASLVSKGVEEAKATELADKFADLDEDKFTEIVALISPSEAKKPEGEQTPEDDKTGAAAAKATDLENAEPESDPTMSTEGASQEDDKVESTRADLKKYFATFLDKDSNKEESK